MARLHPIKMSALLRTARRNYSARPASAWTDCPGRLQRVRIGIWQMELLAQKRQPLLANDLAINDFDAAVEGRMDCVDNSSNTTTYFHILRDIGESVSADELPPELCARLRR